MNKETVEVETFGNTNIYPLAPDFKNLIAKIKAIEQKNGKYKIC